MWQIVLTDLGSCRLRFIQHLNLQISFKTYISLSCLYGPRTRKFFKNRKHTLSCSIRVPYLNKLNKFTSERQQATENNGVFLLILLVMQYMYFVQCTVHQQLVLWNRIQLASRIVLPDPYQGIKMERMKKNVNTSMHTFLTN